MTLRELARAAKLARGPVLCHGCGQRLNKNTVRYAAKKNLLGIIEYVPLCGGCFEQNGKGGSKP